MNYICKYMNYLINDCYMEDFNPFDYEDVTDEYYRQFSFKEWYFYYRKLWNLQPNKFKKVYNHTHDKLIIGFDIIEKGFVLF